MLSGHIVAAVGIAALAAYGETLLWTLLELLTRATAPILQPIPAWAAAVPALHAGTNTHLALPRRQHLARIRTRRGPPALCA